MKYFVRYSFRYFLRRFLRLLAAFSLVLFVGKAYSQPPAWLSPVAPPPGVASATPAAAVQIKTVVKTVRDTVTRADTIVKTDTVFVMPKNDKYQYKLQVCNLDYNRVISLKVNLISFDFRKDIFDNLNNEEKMKNCYSSNTVSDSVYTYIYGLETVRTNGYIYDNYGNKLEQTEKVLSGVNLRVVKDRVKFDYLENKKLSLENSFSNNRVQFYADYTVFERACNFWIFCNIADRKQYIFLDLTREEI